MKIKIIIFCVLFLLLFVHNCVYLHMTHLSDDDLLWMNGMKNYNSIYFVSESGDLDTLSPTGKFVDNSTNRLYFSWVDGGIYEAGAGYTYEMKHNDTIFKYYFSIKRFVDNNFLKARADCFQFYSEYDSVNPQVFRLGNIDYPDCIVFDKSNCCYSEYWRDLIKNKIVKFVVSKEHGLIYYEFENGESYSRKFHK